VEGDTVTFYTRCVLPLRQEPEEFSSAKLRDLETISTELRAENRPSCAGHPANLDATENDSAIIAVSPR